MAFVDMFSEITELVPSLSRVRAKKLVNRALKYVQDSNLWSFQLLQGGFSTPNISTEGSISIPYLGSSQIIGDVNASAQWQSLPFIWAPTTQQIRAQGYSIYSVIAIDYGTINPPYATLTLDRPFIDPLPSLTGVGYQMYQAYQPMPVGFRRFLSCMDMFDMWFMDIWTSRRTEDLRDPTRLISSNPYRMLPLGTDRRGAGTPTPSATLNQQLYEMYPYPTTEIAYQWYAVIDWPELAANSDTLPPQITEEVVVQKALTWAYRDAESRKDIMAAKGSGGNYLALKKQAEEDFLIRLKTLRLLDRDAVDSFMVDLQSFNRGFVRPWYSSQSMRSSPF